MLQNGAMTTTWRAGATLAVVAAIVHAIAACESSDAAPLTSPAPADAAADAQCTCTTVTCQSGAELAIILPVPVSTLSSALIEVCRAPSDCKSFPLVAGTVITGENDTLHVFFGSANVDPRGDRYTVGVWKDDVLFFEGTTTASYETQRAGTCSRTVNGRQESCGGGYDCYRANVSVTLAAADAGAQDASLDVTTDAPEDAPADAVVDGSTDATAG